MHTPAVLAFLHLLAECLLQLVLVAWGVLPPPQVSAAAAKGALLPAAFTALQVCMEVAFMGEKVGWFRGLAPLVTPGEFGGQAVGTVAGCLHSAEGTNGDAAWEERGQRVLCGVSAAAANV